MKALVCMGTRPEAIKLAPVYRALADHPAFEPAICATAQHREMLDQVLGIFELTPEYDLDVMEPGQTLAGVTARILSGFDAILEAAQPDIVIVQGDTTTTFTCALAAFYRQIKVAHVEAGLRTGNRFSPFPEEVNRRMTSALADWHFAPTERSRKALLDENYPAEAIHVVGNTVIDALLSARPKAPKTSGASDKRMVLITCHRRENFGGGLDNIIAAVAKLATQYPDVSFVYPVHLNPNVKGPVEERLGHLDNVELIAPQDYLDFIALLDRAHIVLTDSGGVQEEAPSLDTPVLVMRDTTERQEAVEGGTAKLVGTSVETIVAEASRLLDNDESWQEMASKPNPFGDGTSSRQIAEILAAGK